MEGKDEEKEAETSEVVETTNDSRQQQRESKCEDNDGGSGAASSATSTTLALRDNNAAPLSADDQRYQEGIDLVQAFVQVIGRVRYFMLVLQNFVPVCLFDLFAFLSDFLYIIRKSLSPSLSSTFVSISLSARTADNAIIQLLFIPIFLSFAATLSISFSSASSCGFLSLPFISHLCVCISLRVKS